MELPHHPSLIERLTVEEGFLDGLELDFRPGLNVLIGPRGVGKTSVIELLRFCLNVPAFTDRFERAADDHARSVLGDGRVTVGCVVEGERMLITRRGSDDEPEGGLVAMRERPIVLSQNEIEAVGLDARGRLRIVDGFRRDGSALDGRERSVLAQVASLSKEIAAVTAEIAGLEERLEDLGEARLALAAAEKDSIQSEQTMAAAGAELQELDKLGATLAERSVKTSVLGRTIEALTGWASELEAVSRDLPVLENWPGAADDDPLGSAQRRLKAAQTKLGAATQEIAKTTAELRVRVGVERETAKAENDRARALRRRAEALREGAGAAARRLASLRERVAQLTALNDVITDRRSRLDERREQRTQVLQQLEAFRVERFEERLEIARTLTDSLGPEIEIDVRRAGLAGDYAQAIAEALRGSGLHYTQLAPQLAARMAPYELIRAAEEGDHELVARATGVSDERAERVLERIRASGTAGILSSEIEDAAVFKLLVGSEYRDTTQVSTGQRCTAVLPVLLHHTDRPVVIDQPEDHLDTAFIVNTLVRAIRQRPVESQLIVSTHNPNVPVLGEAAQVTVLGSDGKRGFESHSGELEDPQVVRSITTIMEGGRQAFERRADFYRSHPD